jgi:drug/metabolite transporter (DMT)-like permease
MPATARTWVLTLLAMLAFAANSLLCRLALAQSSIDPASFGSVRLASGALVLAAIVRLRARPAVAARADWLAAAMLWLYVATFSFAYLTLSAGTGALILFGAVQMTMFGAGLRGGERFTPLAWLGFTLAVAGLVVLVLPGLAAPPLGGTALMATAGIAWGVYSLRGRQAGEPVAATAGNFARATPLAFALSLLYAGSAHASLPGVLLAVASGALTSGLGYVLWYAALPGLSSLRAATVQLSVPALTALAGVALLGETLSPRLALASVTILGGIALVLAARARLDRPRTLGQDAPR